MQILSDVGLEAVSKKVPEEHVVSAGISHSSRIVPVVVESEVVSAKKPAPQGVQMASADGVDALAKKVPAGHVVETVDTHSSRITPFIVDSEAEAAKKPDPHVTQFALAVGDEAFA